MTATASAPSTSAPAPRTAPGGSCAHCGLAAPRGARFCCAGCEAVSLALAGEGLAERYYALRELDPSAAQRPAEPERADLAYLDTERFRDRHARAAGGRFVATLTVEGFSCAACGWLVEEVARGAPGVAAARADVLRGALRLTFTAEARLAELAGRIGRLGYRLGIPRAGAPDPEAARRAVWEVGFAFALAANTMLLTLPSYLGLETGELAVLFAALSAVLASVAVFGPGRSFLRAAWAGLAARSLSLDAPIAIGLVAGLIASSAALLSGRLTGLYFDSIAVLVFALKLGRFAQARALERARAAITGLAARVPVLARVIRHGRAERIPSEDLVIGDRIRVEAGEAAPADLVAVEGAVVDKGVVTGEADPVTLAPGGLAEAGTRVIEGALLGAVAAPAPAADAEPELGGVTRAERFAPAFTAIVLCLAAAAGAVAWSGGGAAAGLERALTVLLIACPCALALAIPVTTALALSGAARRGVLVRCASALTTACEVSVVALDKTGTLTETTPRLVADHALAGSPEPGALARDLAAIEALADHPLGRAIAAAFASRAPDDPAPDDPAPTWVRVLPGVGVVGAVGGRLIAACAPRALPRCSLDERLLARIASDGATPVLVAVAAPSAVGLSAVGLSAVGLSAVGLSAVGLSAVGFSAVGLSAVGLSAVGLPPEEAAPPDASAVALALGEPGWEPARLLGLRASLRPGARALCAALRAQGRRLVLLSGDHRGAVDRAGDETGIEERYAAQSPAAKAARIQALRARGRVAMFGDGLNDRLALEAADLAITLACATPAALSRCQVVLRDGLDGLPALFTLANGARAARRRALAAGLLYNVAGIALAASGAITPLLAAILMPLSSLTVVAVALRSRSTEAPDAG